MKLVGQAIRIFWSERKIAVLVDKGLKVFAAESQIFQCFVITVEKVRCSLKKIAMLLTGPGM